MEGVFHEHGDGHGADAAGDGGDGGGEGGDLFVGYVAYEASAGLFGGVRDAVDSYVDDDRAFLDPVCFYHFRAAYGGDENVGAAADGGEVFGTGVGDCDCGVSGDEERCDGFAYEHAAAEDYRFCSFGVDFRAFEEFDAAEGGAGDEAGGVFQDELGDVLGVESIDVLFWVKGEDDCFFADVLGERELNENAVDCGVCVEIRDYFEEFFLGGFLGELDFY